MVQGVIDRYPELEDDALVAARQVNFETIHNHDVVAERTGLLGDLRDEVLHDGPGGAHLTLDGWLALP
jgi:GTP cyclohydrolase I/GTP cyclohydrolase-4